MSTGFMPDDQGVVRLNRFPDRPSPIGLSRYDWIEEYLDGGAYAIPFDHPGFKGIKDPTGSFRAAAAHRNCKVKIRMSHPRNPDYFVVQAVEGMLV